MSRAMGQYSKPLENENVAIMPEPNGPKETAPTGNGLREETIAGNDREDVEKRSTVGTPKTSSQTG